MTTMIHAWYSRAYAIIEKLPREKRMAAMMLLDAIRDVRLREQPEYETAMRWLSTADDSVMSLRLVCNILGVKLGRVQRLVTRLLMED